MTTASLPALEDRFARVIAGELGCQLDQVSAADALFADGSTIPFVARYRKEATRGLIDEQLEQLFKRREYFLELAERRDAILESIREQGKLTGELEAAIRETISKRDLEDLYLPYKPKRRTRAQVARERGLEPLADALLEKASTAEEPSGLADRFIDPGKDVPDRETVIGGARDILAERVAEAAENRAHLRESFETGATLRVTVLEGKKDDGSVYRDYFDYSEPLAKIPSHRLLAVLRGEREEVLATSLEIDDEREIARLGGAWGCPLDTPCGKEVAEATADGYRRLLRPSITNEVMVDKRARAEDEAIAVFRDNLRALLLQSPLGRVSVMGLDPGYRTGCKLAVIDSTGRVVATSVIHPVEPQARPDEAKQRLLELVKEHGVRAIAVGNGTASRETELFARGAIREAGLENVIVAIVPETGASVYSASALARKELPDLDVSLRGAVSIGRRIQDPLAELVKIEPKSLGVGQYQHDVNQKALARELDAAVEGVVNRVGVELNTASPALLRRVSGLSERLAHAVVSHRDTHGAFTGRRELLAVDGFGPKKFELAAGFLRIRDGAHPLDRTAVHPERYGIVERMAKELQVDIGSLVGNPALVAKIDFGRFVSEDEGLGDFTLDDIRAELERPGRDPRPEFKAPEWRDDVQSIADLKPGQTLEGRVSNVTSFGAFVDIGIKRDGLVHVSELSHSWIKEPREVVQAGQIVKVKDREVDTERGRVNLAMKALEPAPAGGGRAGRSPRGRSTPRAGGGSAPAAKSARADSGGQGSGTAGTARAAKSRPTKTVEQKGGSKTTEGNGEGQTTIDDLLARWGKKR